MLCITVDDVYKLVAPEADILEDGSLLISWSPPDNGGFTEYTLLWCKGDLLIDTCEVRMIHHQFNLYDL